LRTAAGTTRRGVGERSEATSVGPALAVADDLEQSLAHWNSSSHPRSATRA
jgi:hypothetical protein